MRPPSPIDQMRIGVAQLAAYDALGPLVLSLNVHPLDSDPGRERMTKMWLVLQMFRDIRETARKGYDGEMAVANAEDRLHEIARSFDDIDVDITR